MTPGYPSLTSSSPTPRPPCPSPPAEGCNLTVRCVGSCIHTCTSRDTKSGAFCQSLGRQLLGNHLTKPTGIKYFASWETLIEQNHTHFRMLQVIKTGGREGQRTNKAIIGLLILLFLGSPYWADGIKYFVSSWETVIHLISCPGPTAYCSPTPHHHHPLSLPCSIRQRHHHGGSTLGTGIKSYYILRPAM